jgi:ferritin-like protein
MQLTNIELKNQRGLTMAKVARQVVEQAGVNVEELLEKLLRASAVEFTSYYYHTIIRFNAIGLDGEGLKDIVEDARLESRNHYEALFTRIYELGGELPRDIRDFISKAAGTDSYLPENPRDIKQLLNVLVEAERFAVRSYHEICNITFGKDHRTYELALAILNEEVEHESWFSEYLGEGPSGHFRRRVPGESPYVSKFLVAPRSC